MSSLLGLPLEAAASLRRAAYERGLLPRARLRGPVVSVGNLSLGGSGKTPVVQRLAEILGEERVPTAVLSRGYGGAFRGDALVVSDGQAVTATAAEAGDEPVMLARALPGAVVAVGRRRDLAGRAVELRFGPRLHLLDDGFQHLRLHRDLDLVCVDLGDLRDALLPMGRLRESPRSLSRADLVLLGGDGADALLQAAARGAGLRPERVLRLRRRVVGFFDRAGEERPLPARPFLLAAIARPERFSNDVRTQVPELAGTAFFRDHHAFRPRELARVAAQAQARGADAVVTTAKDEARLPASVAFALPLLVLRIAAVIEQEARLRSRLVELARRLP